MSESYGIFDSADGDTRPFSAAVLSSVLAKFLRDGVVHGASSELAVSASDPPAMNVSVGPGTALIQGRYYVTDAPLTLPISAADISHPRLDRVVLRLSAVPGRMIHAAVVQGAPAPTPARPALTRTSETYEISLACLMVEPGVTSILSSAIEDERADPEACGSAVPPWVPSSQLEMVDDVDAAGHKITGLGAPAGPADAATKGYADILSVPPGMISMWYGSAESVPAGWHICDGTTGTPDLRNRFVLGAGGSYAQGASGGEAAHALTTNEMPSHNHLIESELHPDDAEYHEYGVDKRQWNTKRARFPDPYYTRYTGGGAAHNNMPPYRALYYIMKL